MNFEQAKARLEQGKSLTVPKQVSWRTADKLISQGHATIEGFVNRWCGILHPVTR